MFKIQSKILVNLNTISLPSIYKGFKSQFNILTCLFVIINKVSLLLVIWSVVFPLERLWLIRLSIIKLLLLLGWLLKLWCLHKSRLATWILYLFRHVSILLINLSNLFIRSLVVLHLVSILMRIYRTYSNILFRKIIYLRSGCNHLLLICILNIIFTLIC